MPKPTRATPPPWTEDSAKPPAPPPWTPAAAPPRLPRPAVDCRTSPGAPYRTSRRKPHRAKAVGGLIPKKSEKPFLRPYGWKLLSMPFCSVSGNRLAVPFCPI